MASVKTKRTASRKSIRLEKAADMPVGVVGLGLMGNSIIACLLAAGHPVVGVTRSLAKRRNTRRHLQSILRQMKREKLLSSDPAQVLKKLCITEDFADLRECKVVIETVLEDLQVKYEVFRKIEAAVAPETIIGSNTSALPVTLLQKGASHPERFMGIHWGEPAHVLRFMEIICGDQTDLRLVERARALAERCTPCCARPFTWSNRATQRLRTWIVPCGMTMATGSHSPGPSALWILPAFPPICG